MLDVLFEQLIFKVGVFDGAAGDVVERQNTDQFLSIDDRYMGDMQRGMRPRRISSIVDPGNGRVLFHHRTASGGE